MVTSTHAIRLRKWKKSALNAFMGRDGGDFPAVATPGRGTTTFALTAARQDLAAQPGRRPVVVMVPTQRLKGQRAAAAGRCGLHLDPALRSGEPLPSEAHGIVTTHQQVAQSARQVREVAQGCFAGLVRAIAGASG